MDRATHGKSFEDLFRGVRGTTERLCESLNPEDAQVQSMPEASPAKWHLAHTTWFFETFVVPDAPKFDPDFDYLFNSDYEAVGPRHPQSRRGMLTRPTLDDVLCYRAHVDAAVLAALPHLGPSQREIARLGLEHEQQHEELILTDILHAFWQNPLRPVFREQPAPDSSPRVELEWIAHTGGRVEIGDESTEPQERVHVEPFRIANRAVTNGEFQQFVDDGGYRRAELWLADGWATRTAEGWECPLYWEDGAQFGLDGMRTRDPDAPACHVSFYEADAFARWAGARLPSEAEWEIASARAPKRGVFLESGRLRPRGGAGFSGDVWEWTASAHNGNQLVLRGGSCATPASHVRSTDRNFLPPVARWQFAGLRLAKGDR